MILPNSHGPDRLPNVIYFHTHDTGRYIEPYGAPVRTPRLQELAERSVVFRNAHAVAPTCSPSRAGLLTGQWAHSAGMLGLAHRGHALRDYREHLVHLLHRNGYTSALIGVQHEAAGADGAATIGYQEHVQTTGRLAPDHRDAAVGYLRRPHDRPFFLSVGLVETHVLEIDGWTFAHPGTDDRWTAPPPTMASTPETRRDMASFQAAVLQVDQTIGAIMDTLAEEGLADSTIVVVTTDHGVAMPGMKCTLGASGTGVMLMLHAPGLPSGLGIDHLVSHVDVIPTLCALIGVEASSWLQGTSLLPTLDGHAVRDQTFAEINFHVSYQPQRAVRTDRHCLIKTFDDRTTPTLPNVDDSPSKDVWVDHGWADHPIVPVRLHDAVFDPHEQHNLADEPAYAEVRHDLEGRLHAWMVATDDPLLRGPIPAPAGFPPQDPDTISPEL